MQNYTIYLMVLLICPRIMVYMYYISYGFRCIVQNISPQTSNDRSRGPYICVIHCKTMIHIVYIMICGQHAAH